MRRFLLSIRRPTIKALLPLAVTRKAKPFSSVSRMNTWPDGGVLQASTIR